ncbi:hypothetical protein ABWW58_10355 [Sporolactobacillus sp. STCC-11]|uniref:hypothetical protein n=1 Tax=Sporolactobacillus caesalpiniae TaxID=3230362 RepID=UPI003399A99B
MSEQVDVFFDESGKDKNQVSLMGALLMPHNYYTCDDIVTINNELKQNKFRLHFTDFSKDSQVPLHRAIRSVFQKPDYLKLNVVAFKKNDHISRHHFLIGNKKNKSYVPVNIRESYRMLK